MKVITGMILQILFYIGGIISTIWAVISFIIYLVKDISFDWTSVYCIIGSISFGVIMFCINLYNLHNLKTSDKYKKYKDGIILKKSTFHQKIEEMKKKREETNNL